MVLGTPFDTLELGVLLGVAAVLTVAEPWLVPPNPLVRLFYLVVAGGVSLLSAALVRALRNRQGQAHREGGNDRSRR